jgi:hypothetical protein
VPALFNRKSPVDATEPAVEEPSPGAPRGYTQGKGKATPKRTAARKSVEAPPANRREAARRMREKNRSDRQYAMEQQRAGNDDYLTARDKGPERALVRDLVDSRRTVGPWLFLVIVPLLVTSNPALGPTIYYGGQAMWALILLGTVVNSAFIGRKVVKAVKARFPNSTQRPRGLVFYAIMRGLSPRFLRIPKPRVELGSDVG